MRPSVYGRKIKPPDNNHTSRGERKSGLNNIVTRKKTPPLLFGTPHGIISVMLAQQPLLGVELQYCAWNCWSIYKNPLGFRSPFSVGKISLNLALDRNRSWLLLTIHYWNEIKGTRFSVLFVRQLFISFLLAYSYSVILSSALCAQLFPSKGPQYDELNNYAEKLQPSTIIATYLGKNGIIRRLIHNTQCWPKTFLNLGINSYDTVTIVCLRISIGFPTANKR